MTTTQTRAQARETVERLEADVARTTAELAAAKAALESAGRTEQDEALAEVLHRSICHSEHTETCAWHYNKYWDQGVHKKYLDMAQDLAERLGGDYDLAMDVARIVG